MNKTIADALIKEYAALGDQVRELRKRRGQIASKFPNGRTEGHELAIYKSGGGMHQVLSLRKLKLYVTEAVLEKCRERRFKNGSLRIVKKAVSKKGDPV